MNHFNGEHETKKKTNKGNDKLKGAVSLLHDRRSRTQFTKFQNAMCSSS